MFLYFSFALYGECNPNVDSEVIQYFGNCNGWYVISCGIGSRTISS